MKIRQILTAASIALLPLAASAATLIVPVAGNVPAPGGSRWQSELTLHNSGSQAINVTLRFHRRDGAGEPSSLTINPHGTVSFRNVIEERFHQEGLGALEISVADRDARRLAVASNTYNAAPAGEFGQDIPAVNVADASASGDVTILAAPASNAYRFNFGLYAIERTTVTWELVRAAGTSVATKSVTYQAGEQVQYNSGIESLLGASAAPSDVVRAAVQNGRAVFYGSAVNNQTGDPTFVPGIRTRADVIISLLGLDVDEDGAVDLADANGDGVVDQPLDVVTSMFPSIFRVVAEGEFGQPVSYEILSSPAGGALLIDEQGTVQLGAPGDLKGQRGELRIRATAGGSSSVLVIPIQFR